MKSFKAESAAGEIEGHVGYRLSAPGAAGGVAWGFGAPWCLPLCHSSKTHLCKTHPRSQHERASSSNCVLLVTPLLISLPFCQRPVLSWALRARRVRILCGSCPTGPPCLPFTPALRCPCCPTEILTVWSPSVCVKLPCRSEMPVLLLLSIRFPPIF